ncbi:MAG: hypothetical protein WCD70_15120 [Alphaproteobacteria bacterium]
MPVWLVPLLVKYGIPLVISILQKTGIISGVEADGIKAGTHVLKAVESVKTYSQPDDFPDAVNQIPVQTNLTNNGNPVGD